MEENKPQIGKIALGFSIIVLSVILIFGNPQVKPEKILGYSFRDEPVEVIGFEYQESEEVKKPTSILRLSRLGRGIRSSRPRGKSSYFCSC